MDRQTLGKKSRKKGADFERSLANRFRLAGWIGAKRHLEFQQAEAQGFDLDGVEPFRVQAKCLERYASIATIKEIHPKRGTIPVLITKADDERPAAVLYLDDFMQLLGRMKAAGVDLVPAMAEDF